MNFVSHISRCDVLVAFGLMSAKQQTLLPLILANINFVTFAHLKHLSSESAAPRIFRWPGHSDIRETTI